jgi:hypothetical protein
MINRFEEILKELGLQLSIPLHPDHRGACKMHIGDTLDVQLEYDESRERLLMASFICEVPPGKFREEVFKAALMNNDQSCFGPLLAYSGRNNQLSLYQYISPPQLTGPVLTELFNAFMAKAIEWKNGVESGNIYLLTPPSSSTSSRPFGL